MRVLSSSLCLGAAGAALAAAAACTEHLPRAFDDAPITGVDGSTNDGAPGDGGDDDDGAAQVDGGADASDGAVDPPTCFPADEPSIDFEPVTTAQLSAPVEVVLQGTHLYVLEQGGRVLRVNDDGATVGVVLDVSSKIVAGGEAGLLGVAFHPQFATNGFVYLYYTIPTTVQPPPPGVVFDSVLVRYRSNDGGLSLDPSSEKRIMTVPQPYSNHNGGTIAFGNDGFLYWGLGDGGSGGDPLGHGQNEETLLGKMLRIDVDGGDPYAIPPTNPFANDTSGTKRREIYALGLRNPYRWRFDPPTGDLWVGDVGQGTREEIDKVTLGGNYGWNAREGKVCYGATTCDSSGLIDPVVDHPRSEATSITGGVVYRGAGVPLLNGNYVYGDFGRRTYFAIPPDDPAPTPVKILHDGDRYFPSAFALDATGEIVITDYSGGGLLRLIAGRVCP
ncbi:MAG: PQQ-dependent sugar dehydrogenase [Labilithrix sp.]|nr:PQQ-dependent sugar dehydrogenase [Labilithrix sp.]MCW5812786.1 PQQ-dependent sugar dehydrogenase [Labilithrix sp.]